MPMTLTRRREYYEENRDKFIAYSRKYRAEHREAIAIRQKEYVKKYRKKNKEKLSQEAKIYREKNREAVKAMQRNYYLKNREKALAKQKKYGADNIEKIKIYRLTPSRRFSNYKNGAQKRGIVFEISFETFSSFWNKACAYCGDPISTIGIDRIDSSKGYIEGNIVPCCEMCNKMKLHHNIKIFLNQCLKIIKHNKTTA